MRLTLSILGLAIVLAVPSLARAQATSAPPGTPTPMPPAKAAPATSSPMAAGAMPKLWAGGGLELLPLGKLTVSARGMSASSDTAVGFAFSGWLDYHFNPLIAVGFAPRFLLNVEGQNGTDSASLLDLRARVRVGANVAPKIRAYGYGALGFADIFLPSSAQGASNPTGPTLTLAGGAAYMINPRLMVNGEIGYEFGFESSSAGGQSFDFKANYLHFGIGITAAVGQ